MWGDRIITRSDKIFVSKKNNNVKWVNNVNTPLDSIKDSLVDMYVLSNTDIKIYNKRSTFAHIALNLQGVTI